MSQPEQHSLHMRQTRTTSAPGLPCTCTLPQAHCLTGTFRGVGTLRGSGAGASSDRPAAALPSPEGGGQEIAAVRCQQAWASSTKGWKWPLVLAGLVTIGVLVALGLASPAVINGAVSLWLVRLATLVLVEGPEGLSDHAESTQDQIKKARTTLEDEVNQDRKRVSKLEEAGAEHEKKLKHVAAEVADGILMVQKHLAAQGDETEQSFKRMKDGVEEIRGQITTRIEALGLGSGLGL